MHTHPTRMVDWLQLIRAEFEEPSGLMVTEAQAVERWPLDRVRLVGLLDALVQARYLSRSRDGRFFRRAPAPEVGDLRRSGTDAAGGPARRRA